MNKNQLISLVKARLERRSTGKKLLLKYMLPPVKYSGEKHELDHNSVSNS